jgi:S-layer protein (TIGR01567 family)
MKKPITIALTLLLSIALIAVTVGAQVTTSEVDIRGEVFSMGNVAISDATANWDSTNFAGFWYDIDKNKSTESLKILKFKDSRTIDKDNLVYQTGMAAQQYKVTKEKGDNYTVEHGLNVDLSKPGSPAGYYALVGWMAEKYVALNGRNNKLSKLVLEQSETDKKTLQVGETWDLGGGYTLAAQSIDAKATPRQVWLVLSKDGIKIDDKVSFQGDVYTYSVKSLAGESDVPIFVTYIDSVFAGQTSDMVQLKYTWVISTDVKEIKSDDTYGIFKVTSTAPITLSNDGALSLSRDSTVDLAGAMKFQVADSDETRFYPFVAVNTPGTVEVRGTVSQLQGPANFSVNKWDARNFAGFWYDIDNNQETESLKVIQFKDNRTIDKDNLVYETGEASQKYKVFKEKGQLVEHGLDVTNGTLYKPGSPAGYYALVGWMAEKYVALNGRNNKLSKLVLEQSATDKKTLQVGETWDLGGGYTLAAQSIDAKATPRQVWLVLSKDGVKIDDKVSFQGDVYTYSVKSLAGETDVPIFVTYIDSVFAGQTSDMVQLKYTWAISTDVKEIKSDDTYGIFKVHTTEPITLTNDGSLSLSRNSVVDLAGEMKLKVADSEDNDVRFYPKVDYQIGNSAVQTPTTIITGNQTPVSTLTGNKTPIQATNVTPLTTETTKTTTTPVATKGTPGFEAVFAIAGLIAVAFIVLRQRR